MPKEWIARSYQPDVYMENTRTVSLDYLHGQLINPCTGKGVGSPPPQRPSLTRPSYRSQTIAAKKPEPPQRSSCPAIPVKKAAAAAQAAKSQCSKSQATTPASAPASSRSPKPAKHTVGESGPTLPVKPLVDCLRTKTQSTNLFTIAARGGGAALDARLRSARAAGPVPEGPPERARAAGPATEEPPGKGAGALSGGPSETRQSVKVRPAPPTTAPAGPSSLAARRPAAGPSRVTSQPVQAPNGDRRKYPAGLPRICRYGTSTRVQYASRASSPKKTIIGNGPFAEVVEEIDPADTSSIIRGLVYVADSDSDDMEVSAAEIRREEAKRCVIPRRA
ncbi:MAG: hypothetical protein BJ554DRAFT_4447 [Olpidium bornovanus]|uniref:Uncharacterized protein n=1 Tax=Olpidium bornovanus TaxID=278681 RepID=A0A8H8DLD1_9FUNG|nr:MAG: hypothetical protein BJ554DRAFT_4447 [Olpidium bornovanus]